MNLSFWELKIKPPYLWGILVVPAFFGEFVGSSSKLIWLVVLLFLVAGSLGVFALYLFYKAQTTHHPDRIHHTSALVTTGCYRITRNPMYLGLLLMLVAIYLSFANPLGFVFVPLFIVWMNRFQISVEERILLERSGEPYKRYCQIVRRWL